MFDLITSLLSAVIISSTPLLFAASGELIVEKAGVLNLGLEGLMLVGALSAFAATVSFGSSILAIIIAAFSGILLSLLFAFLVLNLRSNQIATGLALTIFAIGLTSLLGKNYVGIAIDKLQEIHIWVLSDIPYLGKIFFQHDILVYISFIMIVAIYYFLYYTKLGLILRSVGENHDVAHALGYNVILIRYLAIAFGGAMASLGGAFLSLAYTPHWAEEITAGRGWIALALVVFAFWNPARLLFGAYFFGAILNAQLYIQGFGINIPSQFLSMLPYIATIAALTLISINHEKVKLNIPQALGKPFFS